MPRAFRGTVNCVICVRAAGGTYWSCRVFQVFIDGIRIRLCAIVGTGGKRPCLLCGVNLTHVVDAGMKLGCFPRLHEGGHRDSCKKANDGNDCQQSRNRQKTTQCPPQTGLLRRSWRWFDRVPARWTMRCFARNRLPTLRACDYRHDPFLLSCCANVAGHGTAGARPRAPVGTVHPCLVVPPA